MQITNQHLKYVIQMCLKELIFRSKMSYKLVAILNYKEKCYVFKDLFALREIFVYKYMYKNTLIVKF